MVWRAAVAYFGIVFAAAFGLGILRVLVLVPAIGPMASVALEVPVVLGLSWIVAGWVLTRWPVRQGQRLGMGVLAFCFLLAAEAALALTLGQTLLQFVAAMATPVGALGLAGQIGFAIIPALRGQVRG
ncbi:MAG: hypothetical protein ACRC14_09530 [Paracoccaceae bacterium]